MEKNKEEHEEGKVTEGVKKNPNSFVTAGYKGRGKNCGGQNRSHKKVREGKDF